MDKDLDVDLVRCFAPLDKKILENVIVGLQNKGSSANRDRPQNKGKNTTTEHVA